MTTFNPTTLGGGTRGVQPKLLGGGAGSTGGTGMVGSSERGRSRFLLRNAWNSHDARNSLRAIGTFRAVNNAGDLLSREHYVSGGSNQVNNVRGSSNAAWPGAAGGIFARPDGTGIPSATCNVKYVYDSSDYIRFKKLQAKNRNYNDQSFGGSNNGAYVALMGVRRF